MNILVQIQSGASVSEAKKRFRDFFFSIIIAINLTVLDLILSVIEAGFFPPCRTTLGAVIC